MNRSAMIFGLGDVGGWALEFLARHEGSDTIITADKRGDWGAYRTEMAAVGANMHGHYKRFEFHQSDVNDIDRTAKLLETLNPGVIISTLTLQPPRVTAELLSPVPQETRDKILKEISLSTWLPWNLVPISKLMKAVKKSGIAAHVVNVTFPEITNRILWMKGIGPTVGAGNDEHLAAEIRMRVSERENVPISEVGLYFVGSLSLLVYGPKKGVPFFLQLFVRENEVTSKYNTESLVEDAIKTRFFQGFGYRLIFSNIGASLIKNAMAILNDTNELMHVNAPNGLPGGYPTRLSAKGAEVVLPKGLTLEQAVGISKESLKWCGVEEIKDDGTVVYTDEAYSTAKELLGYDCKEIQFDEVEQWAKELTASLERIIQKF